MTIIDQYPPLSPELTVDPTSALPFDAYRDIHKGVRAELFAVVGSAGNVDPADSAGRAALSAHVTDVVDLLVDHAGHEDTHVLPVLETHAPALFERISTDHAYLDGRLARIAERVAVDDGRRPGRATRPCPQPLFGPRVVHRRLPGAPGLRRAHRNARPARRHRRRWRRRCPPSDREQHPAPGHGQDARRDDSQR